jgi:hypothetical protein
MANIRDGDKARRGWKEEEKEDEQFLKEVFCGRRDAVLLSKAVETRW